MKHAGPNSSNTADMIECGAMALRDEVANRSGRGKDWNKLHEKIRDSYRREAAAVLRATLCEVPP
jgi:hypothetical protein